MFRIFKKDICSPVDGICIHIDEVNDKVFSSKMMGDGFAVRPQSDTICSPIDGIITMIADSRHAFGIERADGLEVLVHIGLDTVNLQGKGFEILCPVGKKVKCREPIIRFDKTFMESKDIDLTTMVIFTSGLHKEVKLKSSGISVKVGDVLLE